MHDDSRDVEARLARFVREALDPQQYRARSALTMTVWHVVGEPVDVESALAATYTRFAPGDSWGAPWDTAWFHITGVVPEEWAAEEAVELVLDLGFSGHRAGYQAEGLLYSANGSPLTGINPRNCHYRLAAGTREIDFYVEAAANPDFDVEDFEFRPSAMGERATAGATHLYTVRDCFVGVLDEDAWNLGIDIGVLRGLLGELDPRSERRARIIRAIDRMLRATAGGDIRATAGAGRQELRDILAMPANASAHAVVAVGHAHIDSAWLWPVRETIRKCSRTFSNALDLMDNDPDFVFAASSAQQYRWMKDHHPAIFERIRGRVADGRFVPVGGMWVESDTNLPGGEALARQFLLGQEFFQAEFGFLSEEVWLPDSFGYTGALPQIARLAGMRWMLTQKMSWSHTNAMPHHTFQWQGIDGTRIFTHLPPVDTYGAEMTAAELAHAEGNFREKGRATTSLVPFGYGDGGGGPTREMMAAATRFRSLEGAPTVEVASPRVFFERAEQEYPDAPVWAGEMYLESHRGTYTTQARTKRGNRRSENLLREVEYWAAAAALLVAVPYPAERIRAAWERVLLLQFHDILPGSSIGWVHREAEATYREVQVELEEMIADSVAALAGRGDVLLGANAGPFAVGGVPAGGIDVGASLETAPAALVTTEGDYIVVDNGLIRLRLDGAGHIVSLVDLLTGREAIPRGERANVLQVHIDTPTEWDAWDIDRRDLDERIDLDEIESLVVEERSGAVVVTVARAFGDSTARQVVTVSPGTSAVDVRVDVEWHERKRLLKLAFPLAVRAERATAEIQFGHVERSTRDNTSWEYAQFETPAQRWVHVDEAGWGVSLANEATYGYDVSSRSREDGSWSTVIRASLLRAPVYPDPDADQGRHSFRFTLRAGTGIAGGIEDGYALNLPVRTVRGAHPVAPLFVQSGAGIVVESVKLAEDGSGDLIVRSYESLGATSVGVLTPAFPFADARPVDILERDQPGQEITVAGGAITVAYRPFEIMTLRMRPQG